MFLNEMIRFCSPSEGRCCKSECIFVASSDDLSCAPEGECSLAAKCDGTSAYCPAAKRKKDGIECAEGTKVSSEEDALAAVTVHLCHEQLLQICRAGTCSESICSKFSQEECQPDDGESCQVGRVGQGEIHNWAGYFWARMAC